MASCRQQIPLCIGEVVHPIRLPWTFAAADPLFGSMDRREDEIPGTPRLPFVVFSIVEKVGYLTPIGVVDGFFLCSLVLHLKHQLCPGPPSPES